VPDVAVNVAVIQDGKILLTKREDFEIWCLPGGGVEPGESLAEAAIRETREETGVDVELTHLVGVYSRLGGLPDLHAVLYEAKPVGGEIRLQPGETIEVEYFPFDNLPDEITFGHIKRIVDAIDGSSGMSVKQEFNLHGAEVIDDEDLYALRDRSGLSRKGFYYEFIEGDEPRETVQLEGDKRA